MKSMRPPSVPIYSVTYFYSARRGVRGPGGGCHGPLGATGSAFGITV